MKFVYRRRAVCSAHSKSLKFYGKKLQALADVCKTDVLKDFAKFTGKHLCQILYLIKLQVSSLPLYCKRDLGVDVFL